METQATPTQIRTYFSSNLKRLAQPYKSTSALSRALGIERSKLSRYMNGTSTPPPEVLARICNHFDCSADIVIRPLEQIDAPPENLQLEYASAMMSMGAADHQIDDRLLPDGFYAQWQWSVARESEGLLVKDIILVKRQGRVKTWRSIDSWHAFGQSAQYRSRRSREIRGLLLDQTTGFCAVCFSQHAKSVVVSQYQYGYKSNDRLYPGSFLLSAQVSPFNSLKLRREFLEYIGNSCSTVRGHLRQRGYHRIDDAPDHVMPILNGE